MKLENVKVGTIVRVKTEMNNGVLSFYLRHRGAVGTVIAAPDSDGDVLIEFDDGRTDYGHHSNLKRIKEKHS